MSTLDGQAKRWVKEWLALDVEVEELIEFLGKQKSNWPDILHFYFVEKMPKVCKRCGKPNTMILRRHYLGVEIIWFVCEGAHWFECIIERKKDSEEPTSLDR